VYLNRCGNPSGPDKTGPRELNDTSNRPFFVMVYSLCGVPGLNNAGSTRIRTGSETSVEQKSKQVTVASWTTPLEIYDGLYSKQYFKNQTFEDQILIYDHEENSMEIITLSKESLM
jgi:hypothetical protein